MIHLPNILTLSRIPCLFLVGILLYCPFEGASTLAFFLYVIGSMTDWLDGFLARRYGMVSAFGKLMDALADKVFVVGVCVTFLALGLLPLWSLFLILMILAREFFVTGLRLVAASRGRVLAAEAAGKLKTCIQLISLGVLLATHALQQNGWFNFCNEFLNAVTQIGLFLFCVATILTIYSGMGYVFRYGDLLKETPPNR